MLCPLCQGPTRRFGHNRNGSQRYRCDVCRKTFTDEDTRPVDRRRLPRDRAVIVLRMLLEGCSIRSTERLTGHDRNTVMDTMVEAGQNCQTFLWNTIRFARVQDVEADEIWAYVGCKEKTREKLGRGLHMGDAWCFTAVERNTKLLLAWHLGKRTPEATQAFADNLRHATTGRFQLTTDGMTAYPPAIWESFGETVDYAQLVKVYGNGPEEGTAARYSPGQVIETRREVITGNPDENRICTSIAERHNKTIRMQIRRMTRLTDGHSKKWENHEAALGLFFAFYNFCRPHSTLAYREEGSETLTKVTPAMASGLTDHVWTVAELLEAAGVPE